MELLRPLELARPPRAADERGVHRELLARRALRQDGEKDHQIGHRGHDLLGAHHGHVDPWQRGDHPAVALVGHEHDRPRVGHGEVGAGDPDVRLQEFLSELGAGDPRQLLGVGLHGPLELAAEQLGHLPLRLVDRRRDDVGGTLVGELDDVFAQVRLDRRDPLALERLVEVDLLGRHRFRFHGHARAGPPRDVDHDPARLFRAGGVVDVAAQLLDVADERLQMVIEPLEGRFLDRPRLVPQGFALGKAREGLAAQVDELGGGDRECLLEERIVERAVGALPERSGELMIAQGRPPSSTSARCSARTGDFRRVSPPRICMRQPASQATRQPAPVASTFASFLSRICVETSGSRTENEPPKPQHSSAPGRSTSSAPLRFSRSVRGLLDS